MSTVALPMTPPSAAHDGSTSVRIFGPSADFIPIRILGHGDIGTVFLVALRQSKQPYAVKVMQKDVLQRKGVKRAATERAVLSMVDHPFLPTLYAYSESAKHVFFLIDFCSGGDLNVFRHKQPNKKCSEAIIKFYAAEIVVALEYLHNKGIIYRDLKPENILIQSNGHIMLTDFDLSLVVERRKEEEREPKSRWAAVFSCFSGQQGGCSEKKKQGNTGPVNGDRSALQNNGVHHIPNDQFPAQALKAQKHVFHLKHRWPRKVKQTKGNVSACRSHSFVGTEEYVAPEVLWGNGHGFSVDWWTVGIFLYEMACGKTPFKGQNRKETFYNILCTDPRDMTSISWPLNDLIKRLLEKNPDSRLGSASGAEEIKKHAFFKGISWKRLVESSRPPYMPPALHLDDRLFIEQPPKQHIPSHNDACPEHSTEKYEVCEDDKENTQKICNSRSSDPRRQGKVLRFKNLGQENGSKWKPGDQKTGHMMHMVKEAIFNT